MPAEEPVFLNKLGEIPVLNDGWYKATDYYAKVKDYNLLTRMTLSMAESSVKVAGHLSTPVLNHYQPQLNNINDYACKKLEELETKYPAIKQPTDQLKDTCADLVDPVVGRVKPVISQVQGMVDNGKQKIVNIKAASTGIVVKAKDTGVGTVTYVFNTTFETAPGRFVTRTVDNAIGMAENLVDKYLPEEKEIETENVTDDDDSGDENEVEKMEEMDPTPKRVLIHANTVTDKIRRRMYRKALKDLTYAKARTTSALNQMTRTVEMIDYAKKNIATAKNKVDDMWTEIVMENPTENKTVFAGPVEDRIVALGRILARQVKTGVTAFEKAYSELGQFSRHPISKTKEYKDFISTFANMESINNFSSQTLDHARESIRSIQSNLTMANISSSWNWLTVDIDMENIPLNESDLGMEQVITKNNNSDEEMEREESR